jgi:hypothetical protein
VLEQQQIRQEMLRVPGKIAVQECTHHIVGSISSVQKTAEKPGMPETNRCRAYIQDLVQCIDRCAS